MNFYNRFIGAIQRKTSHLSMAAFGAYDRLLDWHYSQERPIPLEVTEQWRICGAVTAEDQAIVARILPEFFKCTPEGWIQERAAEEIPKAQARIAAAKKNGKLGGRPSKKDKPAEPRKTQQVTQPDNAGHPPGQPSAEAPHSTLHRSSPSSKTLSKPSASHPAAAGFAEFWLAWPKSERKQDKAACLELWKRRGYAAIAAVILADVRVKRGTEKWADGYIEAPLVYLRNRRWEDGVTPNSAGDHEDLGDWRKDFNTVQAKALSLGMEPWDREGFENGRHKQTFSAYEAKVAERLLELEGTPA